MTSAGLLFCVYQFCQPCFFYWFSRKALDGLSRLNLIGGRMRSSYRRCSVSKNALKNFAKFAGKHLSQINFIKKRLWHRCFPGNFTQFLRTTFLQNTSGRLLLKNQKPSHRGVPSKNCSNKC